MSRNIFSKIFSFYSLKLFFIVIFFTTCFILNTLGNNRANAKIEITFTDNVHQRINFIQASSTNTSNEIADISAIQAFQKNKYIHEENSNLSDYIRETNAINPTASSTVFKQYIINVLNNANTIANNQYDNIFNQLKNSTDSYSICTGQIPVPYPDGLNSGTYCDSPDDYVAITIHRAVRLYVYKQLLALTNATGSSYALMDTSIRDQAEHIKLFTHDGGNLNWSPGETSLSDTEVLSGMVYAQKINGDNSSLDKLDLNIVAPFNNTLPQDASNISTANPQGSQVPVSTKCQTDTLWAATNSNNVIDDPNCSIAAYMVNSMFKLIASVIGIVLGWLGALFNWIFNMSVVNFNSWVENSKAVDIYKTIILSAIASLMLPLVFYLIIRMLIDNDSSKMEKLLPKVLMTALFIYFSFGIAGWLVDQSNIVTIYIYRAIHGGSDSQNFGDVISSTLGISGGTNQNSIDSIGYLGDWSTIAYTFGQILINALGLYIIFQAMILIFVRSIVLLLCLIFSPIMFLPDLPDKFNDPVKKMIKKYKDMFMTSFVNNLLLAPVFMFLMMIAIRIGNISGDLIKTTSDLDSSTPDHPGFLARIIKTIVVVAVMQLSITVAKNLSGEAGETVSGTISSFTGGVASGATKAFNRIRGARQINTGGNANNGGTNPWQTNTPKVRRSIPLQNTQSGIITPSSQSVQNQALGGNFAAASNKVNSINKSVINSLPDTKRRSLAGYQTVSNQRNKAATNKNSVQQKATQNNRSVAAQTQVNNARIERKKNQANAKVEKVNNVTPQPSANKTTENSPKTSQTLSLSGDQRLKYSVAKKSSQENSPSTPATSSSSSGTKYNFTQTNTGAPTFSKPNSTNDKKPDGDDNNPDGGGAGAKREMSKTMSVDNKGSLASVVPLYSEEELATLNKNKNTAGAKIISINKNKDSDDKQRA